MCKGISGLVTPDKKIMFSPNGTSSHSDIKVSEKIKERSAFFEYHWWKKRNRFEWDNYKRSGEERMNLTAAKTLAIKEIRKIKLEAWLKKNPQEWSHLWNDNIWKKYKPKKITNKDDWNRMFQVCSKNPLFAIKITTKDKQLLALVISMQDSVRSSMQDSIWDSMWASVGYIGIDWITEWEYIKHKKGEYPFQPYVDLWLRGLVPSFDGKVWRLHGKGGKILYTKK